jgi:hypothetical protein
LSTNRFDELPPDREPEDVPRFGVAVVSCGFNQEEIQERRDAQFATFSRAVLGNSSAVVSDDSESDVPQGQDTIIVTVDTSVVQGDREETMTYEQEQSNEEVHMTPIGEGLCESPGVAPYAWSSTFAQARREALQSQAMEEQFRWMTEAGQFTFQLGLEPVPWEHFGEAVSQKGKHQFQVMERRATEEDVIGSREQPAPGQINQWTFTRESPEGFRQHRPKTPGGARRHEAQPFDLVYTLP